MITVLDNNEVKEILNICLFSYNYLQTRELTKYERDLYNNSIKVYMPYLKNIFSLNKEEEIFNKIKEIYYDEYVERVI